MAKRQFDMKHLVVANMVIDAGIEAARSEPETGDIEMVRKLSVAVMGDESWKPESLMELLAVALIRLARHE